MITALVYIVEMQSGLDYTMLAYVLPFFTDLAIISRLTKSHTGKFTNENRSIK